MLVGCSYPDFAFAPDTAAVDDTSAAIDTTPSADTMVVEDSEAADAATDAPFDSFAPDATSPDAAVVDSKPGVVADTAAPKGCATPYDFCALFDTVTTPMTEWGDDYLTGGGVLGLDKTLFVSPPASMTATVGASSVTAAAIVLRTFTVTSAAPVVRIEGDLLLDAVTYAHANYAILFKVQRSTAGDGVSLTIGTGGLSLETQGIGNTRTFVTGVTAGKWAHIRMEAVLHTTAGIARLWVDDMTTPQIVKTAVSTADVDDLNRQLLAGIFAYMGAVPFKARFDNVSYRRM